MPRPLDEIKKDLTALVAAAAKSASPITHDLVEGYSPAELAFFHKFFGDVYSSCGYRVVASLTVKTNLLTLEKAGKGSDLSDPECADAIRNLTTVRLFEVAKEAVLAYAHHLDKTTEVMRGREYAALIDEYVAAGGERSDVD